MPNDNPAANPNPADTQDPSSIKSAAADTILSQATDADKQAQATEVERLLNAEISTLSKEDQEKRATIEKDNEQKRLLETPDEKLSEEEKTKKAEIVKAREAEAKAKQVPEKYEFKVPEGMTLDQAFVDEVSPVLKELNITQEGAQKLADAYAKRMQAMADAQAENFNQFVKESREETVKALGPKYKEELAYVARVRDRFFSEETQEMLDASGLSNNKALIFDLIGIGKMISEDKLAAGKTATPPGSKSAAEHLYPNQGK